MRGHRQASAPALPEELWPLARSCGGENVAQPSVSVLVWRSRRRRRAATAPGKRSIAAARKTPRASLSVPARCVTILKHMGKLPKTRHLTAPPAVASESVPDLKFQDKHRSEGSVSPPAYGRSQRLGPMVKVLFARPATNRAGSTNDWSKPRSGSPGWLYNLAPVLGIFTSVDAASFGGGLRLGWLNAVTADLSVTIAQGEGLLGTTALPGLLSQGPRKNTRFFFILSARL